MRASSNIVSGRFFGGEVEPGTFHISQEASGSGLGCPKPTLTARRDQVHASDPVRASRGGEVGSPPPNSADQVPEAIEDSWFIDKARPLFY
jgi:hypothetical protein